MYNNKFGLEPTTHLVDLIIVIYILLAIFSFIYVGVEYIVRKLK